MTRLNDISLVKVRYSDPLSDGAKQGGIAGLLIGAVFGAIASGAPVRFVIKW